jgi:hypothetical protein
LRTGVTESGRPTWPLLPTEPWLVAECVRRAFGQSGLLSAQGPVNWQVALEFAVRHGLAPLFYSGTAVMDLAVPGTVRTKLRARYLSASLFVETHLEPLLEQLLGELAARNLEPIVLKGGALAYLVYPTPAHRSMLDIDLLLPGNQVRRASDVLFELGFRTKDADPEGPNHLRPYYLPGCPLSVELHYRVVEPRPFTFGPRDIAARSQIQNIAGREARVLAPADSLLHVCAHLAAHRYRSYPLRGLVDIMAMTTRWEDKLDWDFFLESVRRSGAASAVYWALSLSRLWLGARVPSLVLSRLEPPAPIRKVMVLLSDPRFLLDQRTPAGQGTDTLYDALVRITAATGCPAHELALVLAKSLFPPRRTALAPSAYTRSPFSYATYLLRPARFGRGLDALGRFVVRLARA